MELYGKAYRAVVVHSDAHDKRRLHRLDRRLKESLEKASDSLRKAVSVEYFCPEDAEAAMGRLLGERSGYHSYVLRLREQVTYARGRPSKEGRRRVSSVRYMIEGEIVELVDEVEKVRQEAGCFVLLTNTPAEGEMGHSPVEVLAFYKEQHGIERNFGFLKDPLVMNGIFLKSPERIEVLGMILLISLLVWNLMEHVMRLHLKQAGAGIPGWDDKPTSMPTSFMMSTKFRGIQIVECMGERCFAAPLTPVQERYLEVLGLDADSLLCYSNHKGKNEEL